MFKESVNSFVGGLDSDSDVRVQKPNTYRRAENVEITGEGEFFSIKNLKGNTGKSSYVGRFTNVSGYTYKSRKVAWSVSCNFKFSESSSKLTPAIVFCTDEEVEFNGSTYRYNDFFVYNSHERVGEAIFSDINKDDYIGMSSSYDYDLVISAEGGYEILYLTDDNNEPRYLNLKMGGNNGSTEDHFSLLPLGNPNILKYKQVRNGGNLPSGSYQFSFMYYDTETGRSSRPSLLTNPIPIFPSEIPTLNGVVDGDVIERVCGGLPNEKANKSILLSFLDGYKEPEKGMYDSIILITVKNIDGSKTPDTKAYYSDPDTSWYNGSDIYYDGSITESDKAIESVILDNVPIRSAKTLEIKEGYMFLGGVKFRDLKLKSGEGTLKNASLNRKNIGASSNYVHEGARDSSEAGEPISPEVMEKFGTTTGNFKSDGIGYKNPLNCANYKSEMRGEVIRYGITYMDKWGNWSAVKTFNFRGFSERRSYINNSSSADIKTFDLDDKKGVTTFYLTNNDGNFNYNNIKIGGTVNFYDINDNFLEDAYIKNYEKQQNTSFDYLTIEGRSSKLINNAKKAVFIVQENGTMSDGSLSHTFITDWKFPERIHPKGALFNSTEYSHGSIASLGVNLEVDDAPDWAVSSAIVRVPRIKNYVDQTPLVSSTAVQTSAPEGKGAEGDGGDIKGSMFPSSLNTPASQSFCRRVGLPVESWSFKYPFSSLASWASNVNSRRFAVASSCFLYPTEMMYQNPDSKAYYGDTISVDDEIKVVDYASTMSTRGVLLADASFFLKDDQYSNNGYSYRGAAVDRVDGVNDLDDMFVKDIPNQLEQNSTSLRADTSASYFGTDHIDSYKQRVYPFNVVDVNSHVHLFESRNITDFIRIEDVPQNVAKIPYSNANLRVTNSIFNYKSIYGMFSDDVNSDKFNSYRGSDIQRSIFVNLQGIVGDPTFFSCKEDIDDDRILTGDTTRYGDFARRSLSFNNVSNGWGENLNVQPQILKSSSVIRVEGDYSPDKAIASRNYFSHTEGSFKVVPIVNISRGLTDSRYGDLDKEHLFTFTGAFSNKVSSKQSFEVFGGDTFIGKHNIKTSDTFFANRYISDDKGWEYDGGSPNQPIPKNWNQILSVYVESAINVDLQGDNSRYPVVSDETMLAYSGRYTYPYHFGYSVNNTLKSFISLPDTYEETSLYKSRVLYSEKHILNSRDGNYGIYRADAYYDLEETYGGITKLLKLYDDNIYALQERSFSIIPVGKSQLEDSTGGSLVVNTESVISTPRYFLNNNGCQDLDSVSVTDKAVIWLDSNNKEVWKFAPSGAPQKISDKGVYGLVRKLIPDSVDYTNSDVSGYYDFVRNKYYLFTGENTKALVWNDTLNVWESEFVYNKIGDTKQTVISSMLTADDKFFSVNAEENEVGLIYFRIYEMFNDDVKYGNFFGVKNSSSIDLIVNAENPEYKTLDVVNIDSNKPLSTMNVVAYDEDDILSQTGVQNINTKRRQGTYEIPTLRSQSNKGRMRGKWFKLEFTIDNIEGYSVRVLGVVNKFRISFRNLISKRQR